MLRILVSIFWLAKKLRWVFDLFVAFDFGKRWLCKDSLGTFSFRHDVSIYKKDLYKPRFVDNENYISIWVYKFCGKQYAIPI